MFSCSNVDFFLGRGGVISFLHQQFVRYSCYSFFFLLPTLNCCFNRHKAYTTHAECWYTCRMLVLKCFYCYNTLFIYLFFNDWCECVGECTRHHDILLVHLSLCNKSCIVVYCISMPSLKDLPHTGSKKKKTMLKF